MLQELLSYFRKVIKKIQETVIRIEKKIKEKSRDEREGKRKRETLKTMSCSFIMCGSSAFVGGIVLL